MSNRIVVDSFENACRLLRNEFRLRLKERFGGHGTSLDFHQVRHSEQVATDARLLLWTLREYCDKNLASEEDLSLVEVEGLGHDLVQEAFLETGRLRVRHRGFEPGDITAALRERGVTIGNERASAYEVYEEMRRYCYCRDGRMVFNSGCYGQDRASIAANIGATYPDFKFAKLPDGTEALKVFQPYLLPESSIRAWALATADLRGTIIFREAEEFCDDGDAEFRELNHSLRRELKTGTLSQERMSQIATAILDWRRTQIGFVRWQKILFAESLENRNDIGAHPRAKEIRETVQRVWGIDTKFERCILSTKEAYESLESRYGSLSDAATRAKRLAEISEADFKKLTQAIGYE